MKSKIFRIKVESCDGRVVRNLLGVDEFVADFGLESLADCRIERFVNIREPDR